MRDCDETCPTCGNPYRWAWEEAFDKFGFGDGDGIVMTPLVVEALQEHGYTVEFNTWGMHNTLIFAIARDGKSLIPETATVGYDDPRTYLPPDIVALLDREFPNGGVR